MKSKRVEYFVFISYSREDKKWAKWLHRKLESFSLPSALRKQFGETLPRNVRPVFRDADIGVGGSLRRTLKAELKDSRYLVVVCSPKSAQSEYVNFEVEQFQQMGRSDRIIPFIIKGSPAAQDPAEQCYPPALLRMEDVILGASLEELTPRQALIKIIAAMLGLKSDQLWLRHKRRERARRLLAGTTAALVLLTFLVMGAVSYARVVKARDSARRQSYQSSMLLAQAQFDQGRVDEAVDTLAGSPEELRNWEWGRMQYVCRQNVLATLLGHGGRIELMAFSPDNAMALTSSAKQSILWDISTGKPKLAVSSFPPAQFSPDGRRLLTGSGHIAKILDITGKELAALALHARLEAFAFSPDGRRVLTGTEGATVTLWDAVNGKKIFTVSALPPATDVASAKKEGEMQSEHVYSVEFSPDGHTFIAGLRESTKIYDAESGSELLTLRGFAACVPFSPDSRWIVTGSYDKNLMLWDTDSGRQHLVLEGNPRTAAFSTDSRRLLAGSNDVWVEDNPRQFTTVNDGSAYLYDTETGEKVLTLAGHAGRVASVRFSPDGRYFVTGCQSGSAIVWDAQSGQELFSFHEGQDPIGCMAFSPDNRWFMAGSYNVKIWDANVAERLSVLEGRHVSTPFVLSPDGLQALAHVEDDVQLLDLDSGKEMQRFKNARYCFVFSADGKRILTSYADNTTRIWEASSGKMLQALVGHPNVVHKAAFSSDGQKVITSYNAETAKIWDIDSGKTCASLDGGEKLIDVAFALDGKRAVTGTNKHTVIVWDSASGKRLFATPLKRSPWELSPDGRQLACGANGLFIEVWDLETGRADKPFLAHAGNVRAIAFSPDGKLVVTGSQDQTAVLWDAQSWRNLQTLQGHTGEVLAVDFSPDGQRVVTGSSDHTLRIWDVHSGKQLLTLPHYHARQMPVHEGLYSITFSGDGRRILLRDYMGRAFLFDAMPWDMHSSFPYVLERTLFQWNRKRLLNLPQ